MIKAKTAVTLNKREIFFRQHSSQPFPVKAIDDLKFFRKKFDECGQKISVTYVIEWIKQEYGLDVGSTKIWNECTKNNIKPWFCKASRNKV